MLEELERVRVLVGDVILSDTFAENIVPSYLRDGVMAYPSRQGKALRPALLLWCCGLYGGAIEGAVKVAAGLEVYHNWTLVHDDIIDDDATRRGEPSAHVLLREYCPPGSHAHAKTDQDVAVRFGRDMAILAGDIQQAWANNLVIDSRRDGVSPDVLLSILSRLNSYVNPLLISGEALDVAYEREAVGALSAPEIENMLNLKTAVLFRFAAESGAMIGLNERDHTHELVQRVGDFAESAALSFQLKDDLLGMLGAESELGKPVGSDLRRGKHTPLFVTALSKLSGADHDFFLSCYGNTAISQDDVVRIIALLHDCGAVRTVTERVMELLGQAKDILAMCPANRYREHLIAWTDYLAARTY